MTITQHTKIYTLVYKISTVKMNWFVNGMTRYSLITIIQCIELSPSPKQFELVIKYTFLVDATIDFFLEVYNIQHTHTHTLLYLHLYTYMHTNMAPFFPFHEIQISGITIYKFYIILLLFFMPCNVFVSGNFSNIFLKYENSLLKNTYIPVQFRCCIYTFITDWQ